jgi:predicted RNA methylase/superfamily II DNA or RNA helicase
MLLLLMKADQLGLFEKLVPVKASISSSGRLISAHTAIRHVRRVEPTKRHAEVLDLFGHAPQPKPALVTPKKPAPAPQADLFEHRPDPPKADLNGMMARSRDQRLAREAKAKEIGAGVGSVKLKHADGRAALLSPDLQRDGGWRFTRLDADGPVGHSEYDSKEAAAAEALRAGYSTDAPEAIQPHAPLEPAVSLQNQLPASGIDYSEGLPAELPAFGVAPGTTKGERRAINALAASMVNGRKSLLDEAPAPVNPEVLRQYSGWGGCGDSLNEFYTDPNVAAAMWSVLHRMGLGEGASVLEPSCGTGVFLELAPKGVKVTGVELDETSSKIAATLHPTHEVVNSALEAFATTDTRQFDAVIGNPPFGDSRGSLVAADKPDISRPEQYFVDTALDKARAGGLVALVLPTGILDSRSARKLRDRWIRKGQFLGALRMPNTAFEASHTGVTTDVVFFRKRPDEVAGALSVVDRDTLKLLGAWDEEFVGGGYFSGRGEGNILGTLEAGWRSKAGMGDDITVAGSMVGVPEAIASFEPEQPSGPTGVEEVLGAVQDQDLKARIRGAAARKPYDQAKRGDTRVIDGVTYVLEGSPLRWHRVDEFMAEQAVVDAGALGADIERAVQGEDVPGLADRVRAYVSAHGIPAKNPNLVIAAKQDKAIYRLLGAVKQDGSLSDVVEGRRESAAVSNFDTAAKTLALEVGYFSPSMVAGRWHGGTEDVVLDHLYASPDYAIDPRSGTWTSLDQYLSGELWPKYDDAKAALAESDLKPEDRAKIERQLAALDEAIAPKSLEDVEIQVNSGFVPLNVVSAFFNEVHPSSYGDKTPMTITYDEGVFAVMGGGYEAHTLRKYLNRDGVRKDDDLPTIERWNRAFKEWLCASAYRDEVEELYNRKFRGFRQKAYSEEAFEVPGLRSDGLKSYQWSGLRWALEAGKGIIAADVGLGKTARALILNKLMKITGQAKRPMIVVPKSVAANWMREAEKWFPGSSVMVIGETYSRDKNGELKGRGDTEAERNQKFHDIRQNDYDFILITQPAWNALDLDPETKEKYASSDFWEKRKEGLGKGPSAKQLARQKEAHDAKIAKQDFQSRSDALYFNDLGVDALISDEMHAYKNLFEARDRFGQQPKFLGGSSSSKRAADMRWKTDWLRDQTGGRNVYGLTATPTKNSPLEVYSMLSHIAPEAFLNIGIRNSEDFLDRFCEFKEENVLDTNGRMTRSLCVKGFKNLSELREIMRRYIDRKTAEDVGLQLPAKDDRQHLVDISASQKEVYAELRELAEKAKQAGNDASGEAHPFSIMHKMDRATLDLELYDPVRYAGARSPKLEQAVTNITSGIKEGGQIVFCDAIETHDKLVGLLVAAGIPRDQIGVLNAKVAPTSAKRQNIAEAYRAKKLRVVIGNSTMEEGVDGLQADTTDIHHLNIPWTPAAIQQRNGRGLRQGNTAEAVRLHNYLAKGTFDGYRYQTISAKKDWQTLLWDGGDRVENLAFEGGMNHEEMLIALAEDPDKAREELTKNKELAQAKLDAQQYADAAEAYRAYRKMRASLKKLDAGSRAKASGQRLEHKLSMMRTSLEANPYFKAKSAIDADHEIMIAPGSGDAIAPGAGLDVPPEGKITTGRYVVEKVSPDHGWVELRRWGETGKAGRMLVDLADLSHAKVTEHDKAAEDAHITAKTAEVLAAGAKDLDSYKKLREFPSAAIEANREAISHTVKRGLKEYKFRDGYEARIGIIRPEGARALPSYEAGKLTDADLPMLPIDEHKKLAFDAYAADEAGKKFTKVPETGRRGASTGRYRDELRYPGDHYNGETKNRWASVIENLWGPEGLSEAHRQFESRQMEAARRAPDLKTAIAHALPTSIRKEGYMPTVKSKWGRKALATLYAKAKAGGHLRTPLLDHLETKEVRQGYGLSERRYQTPVVSEDHFSDGRTYGSVVKEPVGSALAKLAVANGHVDLASAMAVDHAETPEEAMSNLGRLPEHPAREDAKRHLIAKHPHLGQLEEAPRAA